MKIIRVESCRDCKYDGIVECRHHTLEHPKPKSVTGTMPTWCPLEKENEEYRKVYAILNEYLEEEDGSDLIPNHVRVQNMLERLIKC